MRRGIGRAAVALALAAAGVATAMALVPGAQGGATGVGLVAEWHLDSFVSGTDTPTATAKTDVVWISQDFENRIVARYQDRFVKRDGRWLFLLRDELTVPFTPGPPPMSDTAMSVSEATMRPDSPTS